MWQLPVACDMLLHQKKTDVNWCCAVQVRGQLSEGQRQMLGALITIDVHARDVVQELVEAGERPEVDCRVEILVTVSHC